MGKSIGRIASKCLPSSPMMYETHPGKRTTAPVRQLDECVWQGCRVQAVAAMAAFQEVGVNGYTDTGWLWQYEEECGPTYKTDLKGRGIRKLKNIHTQRLSFRGLIFWHNMKREVRETISSRRRRKI